jgi:hypothetical protein
MSMGDQQGDHPSISGVRDYCTTIIVGFERGGLRELDNHLSQEG